MVVFRTDGLALSLVFTPPDVEGWMWCSVTLDVPGFHGEYDCQLLRSDLEQFCSELAFLDTPANWPRRARFCTTEFGIELVLQVQRRGHVLGEYRFANHQARAITLTGTFEGDHTCVRPFLTQLQQELAAK
jgi:hypothetical protein